MGAVIRYDLDAWVRARIGITNEDGGRGYERGVRTYGCPLCDDAQVGRARGWLNVLRGWAGCFNAGCPAEGGLPAVELVRQLEGFATRTEAVAFLRREFPAVGPPLLPALPLSAYEDWCELPGWPLVAMSAFSKSASRLEPLQFCRVQWGLDAEAAELWRLRYCISGRHAWRIIIPVTMGGKLVAFQARSYRNGIPKYLTSKWGKRGEPGAECGRPASALLFGIDRVTLGAEMLLVEGAGDVMRLSAAGSSVVPVGCLGTALTEEKAAILAGKVPSRVIVAFDAGAQAQSWAAAEHLAQWGLNSAVGAWEGAKDAGAGGLLRVVDTEGGLRGAIRRRLAGHAGI